MSSQPEHSPVQIQPRSPCPGGGPRTLPGRSPGRLPEPGAGPPSAVDPDEAARPRALEREIARFLAHAQQVEEDGEDLSLRQWLDLAEAWKIARALRACRGNRSAAARKLGIGRRTLYAKMEKLDITPTWL